VSRIVEFVAAILACAIAAMCGFIAGGRWAPGPIIGALMGIPIGLFFAAAYFTVALWVAQTWPHLLQAHRVGLCAAGVLLVGAILAAIGAWFGYRKSLGASLF
jgi:hypothetical protein